MNNHIRYLEYAKNISKCSDYDRHKVGCILVYKRQIVNTGFNSHKTHVLQKKYNQYRILVGRDVTHKVHAEILCLSKARKLNINFRKSVLYIFREHRDGAWALARPCAGCMEMIKDMGIETICYTTEDGYSVEHIILKEAV